MILASSLQYRESESERAVVEILEDPNAKDAFLKDREGYLSRFNLSSSAKSTLLSIPTKQVISAANEYYQNIARTYSYHRTEADTTFIFDDS